MTPPRILAWTPTYGSRKGLLQLVRAARSTAGIPFDWIVTQGAPAPAQADSAQRLLDNNEITNLVVWRENRGQHHGMVAALKMAREEGYTHLLRLDDDVTPNTRDWLRLFVEREEWLIGAWAGGGEDVAGKLVIGPRLLGLIRPPQPYGVVNLPGQKFRCEMMEVMGGACRLHPVSLFTGWTPDLYAPLGRKDPEQVRDLVTERGGLELRFPDVKFSHQTKELEAQDSPEEAITRRMGRVWCWLGEGV